jgi:hypothetical protein
VRARAFHIFKREVLMNTHDHDHDDRDGDHARAAEATTAEPSQIPNQKSKFEDHPLGPDWIKKYNAIAQHRQALQLLLLNAITDAVFDITLAAAGESPFHNEIEFRAASRLLDLLPALQHPHDIEMEALDRLEERNQRDREHEQQRQHDHPNKP